jgi:hypothetical protein
LPIKLADEFKDSIANRYWVSFNNVFQTYFQSEAERLDFLLNNKHWNSGRIIQNSTREKLSNVSLGKPKPPRTKEHGIKIGKSLIGKKEPWFWSTIPIPINLFPKYCKMC